MKTNLAQMKSIINAGPRQTDLYLSLIDEDGAISCANTVMLKDLELEDPRVAKINFFDLVHPVYVSGFKKIVRAAGHDKSTAGMELYIKNGHYHPMKWQVSCLDQKTSSKNIYLCLGYRINNGAPEKLMSEKLIENDALLNAFMKQTPNLAWVIDEHTRLVFASDAFYKYFGLDANDCVNSKLENLVPKSVFKALYEKHVEVFETGKAVKMIERIKLADGTNYISHINLFPVEEITGRKLVGGHAVSLPDKAKIEADLREANERLLTLNQATTNAIWEWDMQTGKVFRNEALMEMIGYNPDDSKGLSWWLRRIHPEDRNKVSDKVKEATDNNEHSWQNEYRFKCADGEYKHIHDKGFVIYENGLPVKMVGSLQDVSDLKELENKLADERLHRQAEISETVIRVEEKERTRIGYELHDNVNQILSSTLLFVDMIEPTGRDQKQLKQKSIASIKEAIEEIRKLSKELVVPQLKQQGLIESIQYLIDDIHLTHPLRIKFTHDLESDLLSAGKKVTLFRIVQEQLKNILKHSKAKRAEVLLQTKQNIVQLLIKDNGAGFDPAKTHQGIGLSNIYERVGFFNGTADIQTTPGKGCAMTITLSVQ
jgi:PAS domain S-box-containing protein